MKFYFKSILLFSWIIFSLSLRSQGLEPITLDQNWINKISKLAPKSEVNDSETYKLLIFSLHTGFEHWVIPHTEEMVSIIADKSGIFEVTTSKDIFIFDQEKLKEFDAIVLNNTCPEREKRDIFWDVLNKMELSEQEKLEKAAILQNNLIEYVKNGGGLMILHGGITFLNKSDKFSEMVGGSFDYHPPQQEISVKIVDSSNPITAPFKGKDFVHVDEPYFFMGAYEKKDFTPLLYFEIDKISDVRKEYESNVNYISWLKPYGKGRVLYSSLSHNAQSFENKAFLAYMLEGMKYCVGMN